MSYTVSQILVAALRNPELLTSETAAYMVLSLAEQSLHGPRRLCAEHVLLHPGGAITIGDVGVCSGQENDARLRALLRELIERAAPATVTDALERVVRGHSDGPAHLRAELQTALVPLNRAAARRALARLYRKLHSSGIEVGAKDHGANAYGAEAQGADSQLDTGREWLSRRSRRRAAGLSHEEIPVAVDETAFRVASRTFEHAIETPRPLAQLDGELPPAALNWHPAQTTPWQFRDRAVSSKEGTPILGSVLVRQRDESRSAGGATVALLQANTQPLGDAGLGNTTNGPTSPLEIVHELQAIPDEWGDTFVEAPVAEAGEVTEAAPTFNPRRSRVSELVQRMPTAIQGTELARKNLLDMVNASHDELEFVGSGTVTPPPVARDAQSEMVSPPRRGPRRIVLSTLAAGAAGICAWAMFTPSSQESPVVATPPRDCEALVHVEVPRLAKVFLNDSRDRAVQSGPLARFEGVRCVGQAEVTVQVPSPAGSPLPDAWVRMPLPEIELRAASSSGEPLVVAPLGEHK